MKRRTQLALAIAAGLALGLLTAAPLHAQEPAPLRLMVGYAPGGVTDSLARILADGLRDELKRGVIVDNRPGGGGRVAGEMFRTLAPDGSTFLLAPDAWAIFPTLLYTQAELKYNILEDMAPVARLISFPLAFAINDASGAKNAREYAAWLKANPQGAFYGSAGTGSITQFLGNVLGDAFGTPLGVIPYKGNGPLMTDLMGGQVPAGILVLGDALRQRSEKVRVLGIMTRQRWSLTPDIPTLAEQGYDVTAGGGWMGLWAPARTPKADMERMQGAIQKVMARPDVRDKLAKGLVVMPDYAPGAELDRELRRDLAFWGPVIKASGYKAER